MVALGRDHETSAFAAREHRRASISLIDEASKPVRSACNIHQQPRRCTCADSAG
jgi:hypothetical protein